MSHNRYIGVIAFSGVLAWIGWLLVINKLGPFESMGLALSLFFVTFLIAVACSFAVLGYYFRIWLFKNEIFYQHISVSMRQGILLSMIASLCLVLQMLRVLTWWSGLLVVFVFLLLEFYFSSKDSEMA